MQTLKKIDQNNSRLLQDFQQALKHGFVDFFYQPIIGFSGNIKYFEALLRWNHHKFGLIHPGQIIPQLENTSVENDLIDYSLRINLERLNYLHSYGKFISLSINISVYHLSLPDFADRIQKSLQKFKLDPRYLIFEITERSFLDDDLICDRNMQQLTEMGIRLQIDDFGSGFTSISSLQKFSINAIKLDGIFVHNLEDRNKRNVIKGVLAMARELGLVIIAEGIETKSQLNYLREINVDGFQGYFISQPLPFDLLKNKLD